MNLNLSFTLLREPFLKQHLLSQRMLNKQLGWNFYSIHLAVVLFNDTLQDQSRRQTRGIGCVAEPPNKFAGAHLKQLNCSEPFIAGQGKNITADR